MELLKKNKLRGTTMSPEKRIADLHDILKKTFKENIEGSFVECGIWKGGNIIVAKKFYDSVKDFRQIYGYDTFTGMTPPSKEDGEKAIEKYKNKKNWCLSPYDEVLENFSKFGINPKEITLVQGEVEKTLLIEENLPEKIAVLRLDTDFYSSTKIELEVLYPRLVTGGYLIVDDYGHWEGSRKAVNEYFTEKFVKKHFTVCDVDCIYMEKL
jgi:O-methyltransferase